MPCRRLRAAISLIAVFVLANCAVFGASGQSIIAQWSFNGGSDADPSTGVTTPSTGTGTAQLVGGVKGVFATGSADDPESTDNSGWNISAFPTQGSGPKTAGVRFNVNTAGYQGLSLLFDWRASNTASRRLAVLYSANGTDFVDATGFTIEKAGAFTNGLKLDLTAMPDADDNPHFAIELVSDFADGAEYLPVSGASYSTAGTWRFDMVTVMGSAIGGDPVAPVILTQPLSVEILQGSTALFSVLADGTPPLTYQWTHDTRPMVGATNDTLTLTNVSSADSGQYRVAVANAIASVLSDIALLSVTNPPVQPETTIADLHLLLDPLNYQPTDGTTLFTVTGVVTTYANLTGPNANILFYIQDATAGIAVLWTGGTNQFIPRAGDKVRVTAPLTHYYGLLQLWPRVSNKEHAVTLLGTGNPLPAPFPLSFGQFANPDPSVIEPMEGSYVVVSNVFLDRTGGTAFPNGGTIAMTDAAGDTFDLWIDSRTDIAGQAIPSSAVTVLGVLSQSDKSKPYTGGYALVPTRFADIISPAKPPSVWFTNVLSRLVRPGDLPTNTFTQHTLRPGEKLVTTLLVTDPAGHEVTIGPSTAGLPASARWDFPSLTGTRLDGTFTFEPSAEDAGKLYQIFLLAWSSAATNTLDWSIYVPSLAEQQMVLTEFLANPASSVIAEDYNPLHRESSPGNPSVQDEYIELANLGPDSIDLGGWSIADAVRTRHVFGHPFPTPSSGAVIVYGGPITGGPDPVLDVPCAPASESSDGLALNNTGSETISIFNADTNLVIRLVYFQKDLSTNGSLTRYPDANGPFVAQTSISTNAVSPGRNFDGSPFSEPAPVVLSIRTPPQDQSAESGGDASFTVEASGTEPLGYQWQFEKEDLANENAATLTLTHITPAQAGHYRVRVSDSTGSITSSEALLTVSQPPEVGKITIAIESEGAVTLRWQPLAGRTCSVWVAGDAQGPYTLLMSGLEDGSHTDAVSGIEEARYYRVSSP